MIKRKQHSKYLKDIITLKKKHKYITDVDIANELGTTRQNVYQIWDRYCKSKGLDNK